MEGQNQDGNHHGNETNSPSQSCFWSITATSMYASNKKYWTGHSFFITQSFPRGTGNKTLDDEQHIGTWVAPTGEVPSGPPETKLRRIPENLPMEF